MFSSSFSFSSSSFFVLFFFLLLFFIHYFFFFLFFYSTKDARLGDHGPQARALHQGDDWQVCWRTARHGPSSTLIHHFSLFFFFFFHSLQCPVLHQPCAQGVQGQGRAAGQLGQVVRRPAQRPARLRQGLPHHRPQVEKGAI